jgi:hypothetical protein
LNFVGRVVLFKKVIELYIYEIHYLICQNFRRKGRRSILNGCSKVDYLLLLEVGTPLKRVHEEDYTSGVWLPMNLCGSEAGHIKSCDGC